MRHQISAFDMSVLHAFFYKCGKIFHTALVTCLALAACATSESREAQAFRVALLTPGPVSDQSWNAGAYAGLLRIRDSLGASISHIQ
ncbi:MAG TPA: hypothetical protein VNL96_00600, partial [Gemmatimonadaceae bacterium]|nr:hypothetical protein [Gemmatimonadaceae bacterium]